MNTLNIKADTQLVQLLEENGVAAILNRISVWTSKNIGNMRKDTIKPGKPKKKISPKSKAALLQTIKDNFPDWNLGKGKGISKSALKDAIESGVKPEPQKRKTTHFTFQEIVRADMAEHNLNPQQIIRVWSRRWNILKTYASENGKSTKEIVESEQLLAEVAKHYKSISEDLEGLSEKPVGRNKSKKKKIEQSKPSPTEQIQHTSSVAGMFDMSDSDDEDEN